MNQKIHKVEVKLSIKEISKEIWNELANEINNPFYEWTWIKNLEISKSVSRETGWQPLYFVAYKNEEILGIAPLFLKNHSYGEFIFDQSFARLAQELNLTYYPKLITAIPFTPVKGPRFLYEESNKEIVIKSNKKRFFLISSSPLIRSNKKKGILIVMNDVTHKKQLEKVRQDFVANVSHELKTPIASIIGYCETLINESPKKNSKKEEFLKTMFNEASRMSSLVKDLLSLTRIERIEYIPPEGKVNLNEILENIRKTCKERKFLSKTKYQFSIPKRKTEIIGDESELEQVFFNIIENALTHSQSKKPVQIKLMTKLNSTCI